MSGVSRFSDTANLSHLERRQRAEQPAWKSARDRESGGVSGESMLTLTGGNQGPPLSQRSRHGL